MTHPRYVMGLDPSLAGFGLCVGAIGEKTIAKTHRTAPAKGIDGRCRRYAQLITWVQGHVLEYQPELILLEDFSMTAMHAKGKSQWERIGLAEALRYQLHLMAKPMVEVHNATLKRFCRGKAGSGKLIESVRAVWNFTADDDNQADAYALMRVGMCLLGMSAPEHGAQHDVVTMLRPKLAAEMQSTRRSGR